MNERRIITSELLPECNAGLIPFSHLHILSSNLHFKHGWIDEHIRKPYCRYAIRLAFKKHELKNIDESKQENYKRDIENSRKIINTVLSNIRK